MAWITSKFTLAAEPKPIQTKTGTPMASAFGFCKLGNSKDTPDLAISLTAFGSVAESLLNHDKGNTIHISGDLSIHVYTSRENQQVEQLQCTLDTLTSAKSAKPARGQSRGGQANPANGGAGYGQSPTQMPSMNPPGQGQYGASPQTGNQYQGDMGFQQRAGRPAPQMTPPTPATDFTDDDINF